MKTRMFTKITLLVQYDVSITKLTSSADICTRTLLRENCKLVKQIGFSSNSPLLERVCVNVALMMMIT